MSRHLGFKCWSCHLWDTCDIGTCSCVSGPVICKTELVIVSSLGDGRVASTVNGGEALEEPWPRVSTQQTLALVIAKYVNKT